MAKILVIGSDIALLEGLAQTLGATGHAPVLASSVAEAVERAAGAPPLIAVVERALAASGTEVLRLPLAPGGALVLYNSEAAGDRPAIARAVQRLTLAELTLPLERQRLVALAQHLEGRAISAGRGGHATSGEQEHRA